MNNKRIGRFFRFYVQRQYRTDDQVSNSIGAAPLNSPESYGNPHCANTVFGANNTDIATMAAVQAAIAAAGTGAGIVTYSGPSLTFSGTCCTSPSAAAACPARLKPMWT